MLLAIDIGNSSTKFGVFNHETLIRQITIPTDRDQTAAKIKKLAAISQKISAVVISSVVLELDQTYREFSAENFNIEPFFVDGNFDFGFEIKYDSPLTLGADRLVDAFAAVEKYGKPCLVGDFGTATTIDFVNSKNEYRGGIIAPGLQTLADSLYLKTSKLPRVEIVKPASVFGDSTVASIQSGVYFGYLGFVENILRKMIIESGEKPRVIATGGFARIIADEVKIIDTIDSDLLLDGLRLIYERIKQL